MNRTSVLLYSLCLTSLCGGESNNVNLERKAQAERYFRGVYECNPSVIDQLAAEDLVISYPEFEQIYGRPAIQGREAAKAFSARFCSRWLDPELTINEAVAEQGKVVLVWTFSAHDTLAQEQDRARWGGITFLRFDSQGKVVAEIGEESAPGPIDRIKDASKNQRGLINRRVVPADAPEPRPAAPVRESSETMNPKPETEAPTDSGGR